MDNENITPPVHLGFVLDGNRRWAHMHSLPEFDGHMAGYSALKDVLRHTFEKGVKYVTVYAFSNENWQRDGDEVSNLMRLVLHAVTSDLKELTKNQVQVKFLGRSDRLSSKVLRAIEKAEDATKHFTRGTLAICFNYGGQQEIVDATRRCIEDGLKPEEVDEEALAARLYSPEIPPVDLVVRTSGEQRISNFMLWRIAYSEFMFIDKYWPDMTEADVTDIIKEYNRRKRRFGA
ncbi:MAG TPA: polyprenyl diphosphate synthase [Patescibacteria group bacterium]|nr:polyprenyl diphosphate synthase [Patescibacteria group bacterium]